MTLGVCRFPVAVNKESLGVIKFVIVRHGDHVENLESPDDICNEISLIINGVWSMWPIRWYLSNVVLNFLKGFGNVVCKGSHVNESHDDNVNYVNDTQKQRLLAILAVAIAVRPFIHSGSIPIADSILMERLGLIQRCFPLMFWI